VTRRSVREVRPCHACASGRAPHDDQKRAGTSRCIRRLVQVQCHPFQVRAVLQIQRLQRLSGGRNTPHDILSYMYKTKCPHEYGTVMRIGHVRCDRSTCAARRQPSPAVCEQVGLLVLGTHGRTGLAHLIMGSVAERVVRLAPCPVLTVHASTTAERSA